MLSSSGGAHVVSIKLWRHKYFGKVYRSRYLNFSRNSMPWYVLQTENIWFVRNRWCEVLKTHTFPVLYNLKAVAPSLNSGSWSGPSSYIFLLYLVFCQPWRKHMWTLMRKVKPVVENSHDSSVYCFYWIMLQFLHRWITVNRGTRFLYTCYKTGPSSANLITIPLMTTGLI